MSKATAAALLLFGMLFVAVSAQVLRATEGRLGYALDDPYIHMTIARNLAQHGVWGINPDRFASASSSPLWTILLAGAFRIAGVHDAVPLLLNLTSALAFIAALAVFLRERGLSPLESFAVQASVMLFAPIVPMVWVGMEHSLNNLLVLLIGWACLEQFRPAPRFAARSFLLLLMLAGATRLEGLFVAGGCAVALAAARRLRLALGACLAAAAPVVAFGAWNLAHGWFFLPASVMMKQAVVSPAGLTLLDAITSNIVQAYPPYVFVGLLLVALIALGHTLAATHSVHAQPLLTVFVVAALLHLCFARFGYLYRYESYLMVLGVLAVGLWLHAVADRIARTVRVLGATDVIAAAAVVAVVLGNERTLYSNAVMINTAGHIYRQQRQMARFLGQYYAGESVAVNDIGAVSYYSNAKVYDLAGLASLEAAIARRQGAFDSAYINEWLGRRAVPIAIVYDSWYPGEQRFFDRWERVGRWVTDNQDELTQGAVTFYARGSADAARLRRNLADFAPRLPRPVTAESFNESVPAPAHLRVTPARD